MTGRVFTTKGRGRGSDVSSELKNVLSKHLVLFLTICFLALMSLLFFLFCFFRKFLQSLLFVRLHFRFHFACSATKLQVPSVTNPPASTRRGRPSAPRRPSRTRLGKSDPTLFRTHTSVRAFLQVARKLLQCRVAVS